MSDSTTIHPAYLAVAVALLWFPRSWLRTGKRLLKKRRKPDDALERLAGMGARDPENKSVQIGQEFGNSRNYVDLFRALVGAYSLAQYSFTASDDDGFTFFVIQAVVLLVASLIQSIRYEKKLSFYAPIFFFLGMSTGFSGSYIFLFALALVLAINTIIPNPRWFLTAFGVFALPLGVFFKVDLWAIASLSGCILLIPLLSLLSKRPLVVFTRKRKGSSGSS